MDLREDTIYVLLFTGHSNCAWYSYQAAPVGYVNEHNGNKVVRWDLAGTTLIVDDAYTPTIGDNPLKTRITNFPINGDGGPMDYGVLTARFLKQRVLADTGKNVTFCSVNYASNGSSIDDVGTPSSYTKIGKGTPAHGYMIQALQKIKTYADSVNKKVEIPFVYLLNGALDLHLEKTCTTALEYKQLINAFKYNIFSDTKQYTGQKYVPRIYRAQEHVYLSLELDNINEKMIAYDALDKFSPLIIPTYQLSMETGGNHFGTTSGFKLAVGLTEAIYNELNKNSIIVKPVSVTKISSNSVRVVTTAKSQLQIITKVTPVTGHGFKHFNGTILITATSAVIDGQRDVIVTFSEPIIDGVSKLAYMSLVPSDLDLARNGSFIGTIPTKTINGQTNEQYLLSFIKSITI